MRTILAALIAVTAVTSSRADRCVCVRHGSATTCNVACMTSAPPDVVDMLKRSYPDLQIDQGVNLSAGDRPSVDFWTPTAHMACRLKIVGSAMVIDRCKQIHDEVTMKVLLAATMLVLATPAFAEVHIINDPGGDVSEYVQKFHELRKAGERLVIDGPCLAACTLFTGIIPHDHVCVTDRAVLGFKAASYFDETRHTQVPTRQGTAVIMRLYPPEIREWIESHGGLTPQIMALRGKELSEFYDTCSEEQN